MENAKNPKLYKSVLEDAKKKFDRFPSAYASMWISKEYVKKGGEYKKKTKGGQTARWLKEEWIQVLPYLKDGSRIACGSDNKDTKVCRPFKKVDSKTPITIGEILKKNTKESVKKLALKKNKDMKGRVYWKTMKFLPSKKN
mgnify:CR=1 FL=1